MTALATDIQPVALLKSQPEIWWMAASWTWTMTRQNGSSSPGTDTSLASLCAMGQS